MFEKIKFIDVSESTIKSVNDFVEEWFSDSSTVQVMTSGSTGEPKSLQLEKEKMIISAKKTISFLNLNEGDTALLCLSTATIAGKMMIIRAIIGNMHLLVCELSSNPLCSINEKIDFVAMVPLQLHKALEKCSSKLNGIKSIIIGGGPISRKIENQLVSKNISLFHTFGMTETISHIALRQIGDVKNSYFKALNGVSLSSIEDRLVIDFPELGIDKMQTNDIVNIIDNKTFEWIGRVDFIINSGGIKINPEELEDLISEYIDQPFFVAGIPDEVLGEKVILIIESQKELEVSLDFLKHKLPKHVAPKEIICIPNFIKSTSDKIKRKETLKLIF